MTAALRDLGQRADAAAYKRQGFPLPERLFRFN